MIESMAKLANSQLLSRRERAVNPRALAATDAAGLEHDCVAIVLKLVLVS